MFSRAGSCSATANSKSALRSLGASLSICAVAREVAAAKPENAARFLSNLVAQSPEKIIAVATDFHPAFTDWRAGFNEDMAVGHHPFAVACRAHGIVHTRSIPPYAKPPKIRSRGVEIR